MKILIQKSKYFFLGIFLFAGIPLLSWGLGDFRTYFSSFYRFAYTVLMIFLTLLVVFFVPNEGRGEGEGVKLLQRQKLAILYLQMISFLFVILSPISDRHNFLTLTDIPSLRYLGLAFTFIGYFLMNWSVKALGKQFSINVTIQKDHELITNGPYRVIRHPRYLGLLIFFTGISLVFRSWISLVFVFLTTLVILWRIGDEEKLMQNEFLEKWNAYAQKTWRLIPFLY